MSNLRRRIVTSNSPFARLIRGVYRGVENFSIPAPKVVVCPIIYVYFGLNGVWRFLRRVLIAEPYFKGRCASYGRHLHTGVYLHYISGHGAIVLGDDVLFDGKCTFVFAARFSDRPTLEVGNSSDIGHDCMFTIGKRITIGSHCMIASGVWLFDSNGHPADPAMRKAGLPPASDDVKPVTIGDNVWIGRNSTIFPGVTIGDGSIVSTGSVVVGDVAAYTVVAGNPARKIATLPIPPG